MHTMTFRVPAGLSQSLIDDLLHSSIAGGHDRAPTPTRCELRDGVLILEREIHESAPAYVPWEIPRAGRLMVPTTTLMSRDRPYPLVTELARGKINQVRNQYADWQAGGLNVAPDVDALLHQATHAFSESVMDESGPQADQRADESLAIAVEAAGLLVQRYQDQVYRMRHQRQAKFDTALGCRIGSVPARGLDDVVRLALNAACVPLTWGSIEPAEADYRWADADATVAWAASRNLRTFAGPLIDFSEAGLPEYVRKLAADPVTFKSLMCDYVETVVTRYRGKVSRWLITSV